MFAFSDHSQYLDRFAGFFVYVSNTTSKDNGYLCYHDESTDRVMLSFDQHINCSLKGRYVIYYNERIYRADARYPSFYSKKAFNELCEVEVYGGSEMIKLNKKINFNWIKTNILILAIQNENHFAHLDHNLQ